MKREYYNNCWRERHDPSFLSADGHKDCNDGQKDEPKNWNDEPKEWN